MTPFRVLITLLITYLLSPLALQVVYMVYGFGSRVLVEQGPFRVEKSFIGFHEYLYGII